MKGIVGWKYIRKYFQIQTLFNWKQEFVGKYVSHFSRYSFYVYLFLLSNRANPATMNPTGNKDRRLIFKPLLIKYKDGGTPIRIFIKGANIYFQCLRTHLHRTYSNAYLQVFKFIDINTRTRSHPLIINMCTYKKPANIYFEYKFIMTNNLNFLSSSSEYI